MCVPRDTTDKRICVFFKGLGGCAALTNLRSYIYSKVSNTKIVTQVRIAALNRQKVSSFVIAVFASKSYSSQYPEFKVNSAPKYARKCKETVNCCQTCMYRFIATQDHFFVIVMYIKFGLILPLNPDSIS